MILRRLSQSLREQNWTAIWIEFVLLVAGVFLGIQVSNWNAAREDALLGQDYVRRLRLDLNSDLGAMQAQTAYYTEVLNAIKQTDTLLQTPDADPKALVINAYRSTEIIYQAPIQASWQQIVSSGHLGLLPKGAVEDRLAGYYSFNNGEDIYKILNASIYRRVVRDIVPIEIQEAMRAGCSDKLNEAGYAVGFMNTCTLDVEPTLLQSTAQTLQHDADVARTLRSQYSSVYSAVQNSRATINLIEVTRAALGAVGTSDGAVGK